MTSTASNDQVVSAPPPAPLGLEAVVPLFRSDLLTERGPTPVLWLVSDPAGGKKFSFYEFELSVARMLDGRRRAAEVLASADRLGIPVDLEGLGQFIRQLELYGFLAAPGSPHPSLGDGARGRTAWDEETRTLYRAGVRLMHLGRPKEASGYFTTILEAHPENEQAAELLAAIGQGLLLEARPLGAPAAGSGAAAAPGKRRPAAAVWLAAAAGVLLAAALLALLLRRPEAPTPPQIAGAAAPAQAGPPAVGTPPPPAAPPSARWRGAPVERRWRPVAATVVAPAAGAFTWRPDLGRALAAGEPLGTLRIPDPEAPPTPAQQARLEELGRLSAQDPVYREFLEREQAELAAARARGREVPVKATAAGLLRRVAGPAAQVARAEVLAQLLDPGAWRLEVEPPEPPPLDAACEVAGDAEADRASCRVLEVGGGKGGRVVTLAVDGAPWLEQARAPYVRLGPPPRPPGAPP